MFWTTGPMSDSSSMHIVRIPFLTVRDNTMSGEKPLRTYVGPNYTGGVSDHCPVLLDVKNCQMTTSTFLMEITIFFIKFAE